MFNSKLLVYQRVNLHFPMVFLWFSHGFPMVFLSVPKKNIQVAVQIQRRLWRLGRLHHLSRQSDSAGVWLKHSMIQWIGLRDNKTGKNLIFNGKIWENRWFPVPMFPTRPYHSIEWSIKSSQSTLTTDDYCVTICYFLCYLFCIFSVVVSLNLDHLQIQPRTLSGPISNPTRHLPYESDLLSWRSDPIPPKIARFLQILDVYLPTKSVKKAMEIFHDLQ